MKKILTSALCFIIISLIISCKSATVVRTKTLNPADIDMSAYRNIAIASTDYNLNIMTNGNITFKGAGDIFSIAPYTYTSIYVDLSKHLNSKFISDIQSTGYFNKIITPPDSDLLAKAGAGESLGLSRQQLLAKNEINAIILTNISDMRVEEIVESVPVYKYDDIVSRNGKKTRIKSLERYDYVLKQTAYVDVELKIVDAKTLNVITVKKLSNKKSKSRYITYGLTRSYSMETEFNQMLDDLSVMLVNMMIPHYIYRDVKIMSNKPKLSEVKSAYSYVKEGKYVQALEVFKYGWQTNLHVPSGYNAALLLHALGRIDEAIAMAEEVRDKTGSAAILPLLGELKAEKTTEDLARKQL